MSFVPRTGNGTLWALLGMLVGALVGLEWWSRRERSETEAETESPNPSRDLRDEIGPSEHGWSN